MIRMPGGLVIFLSFSVAAIAHEAPTSDWVKVDTNRGISIFRKEIPGDPVYAYKGEGTLHAPLGKIISVSLDVARQPEWVDRLEIAKILREPEPNHRIIYLKVDLPWPVSDRDFVIDARLVVDPIGKTAIYDIHSVEDPLAPPNKCCVRGQVHYNRVELKGLDGVRTEVSAEAHVDPKGSIPKWIVNRIQKSFPKKSIEGMLKQVAKPDIQNYFGTP
jgi:hypothetical protein